MARRACARWLLRIALVAPALLALRSGPCRGDDVVYLKAEPGGRSARKLIGQIVDYTGRELKIKPANGPERSLPAGEVEHIDTNRSAEQTAGDELFAEGEQMFFAKVADKQIAFQIGAEGRAAGLILYQAGRDPMPAARLP